MSFDLKISLDDGGAPAAIDRITGKLEGAEVAAKETTAAMTGIGTAMDAAAIKAAQVAGQMTEGFGRAAGEVASKGKLVSDNLAKMFDIDLVGPQGFMTGMEQIDRLLVQGKISVQQYEDAIAKLLTQLDPGRAAPQGFNEDLKLQEQLFQRIRGPAEQYAQQVGALEQLLAKDRINAAEFDTELGKLNQKFAAVAGTGGAGGMSSELERQAKILERLHGPLVEYEADLAAIEALYRKGKLSGGEYEAELDRIAKKAGVQYGPVAPPAPGSASAPKSPEDPVVGIGQLAGGLGQAGNLLAGGAVGAAVVGLGEHVQGLIDKYHELQDTWTNATNTALKFTDGLHSANLIIDEQIRLAHDLHSTEAATIELYDTIRDGTDDLNVSHQEQIRLTKSLGEEVQIAGRSLDSAGSIVTRFTYAIARGSISVLELQRMMKQVPELGDLWTKSFDTDRQGLIAMVRAGQVGVEALMRPLLEEGAAIDKNFERRQRTIKQKEEEWQLNEKLYSQKYGTTFGAGNYVNTAVQNLKGEDQERLKAIAESGGLYSGIAAEAIKQHNEEFHAGMQETIDDVKNLTGFLRPLGDRWRELTGDTAAIRAEIVKINEPIEAARAEIDKLNKAFDLGKIDVIDYTKHWQALQTTLGRGVGPQALKITEPIRQARLEMTRFLNEIEAGANVSQAQTRKALAGYQTTIQGFTPEDLKINNPKLDAADQMADLNAKQKEGKITAEAYRKEYDALITTMNDGRLPAVIKLWESFTLPLRDWREELSAAVVLLQQGRISLLQYDDELSKIATSGSKYVHDQVDALLMTAELQARLQAQTRTALQGTVLVTPDAREQFQRYQAKRLRQDEEQRQAGQVGFAPSATSFASVRQSLDELRPPADADQKWKNIADQQERAMNLTREFYAPAVTLENALKDIDLALQTYSLTQEQANVLQIRAKDAYFQQSEALRVVKGPLGEYEATLRKLGHQAEDNAISQQKYTDAVRAARVTFLEASGAAKTFGGAMEVEWIKMQQDAEAFGASVAKLVVDDFGKLNDAIVTAANGGEVAWGQMIESMLQDLERLALKMLEIKLIQGIGSLFGGEAGAAAGLAGAVTGTDTAAGGASELAFATGGSFVVGGSGGTDSQDVNFKATPGEIVTVMRPSDAAGPGAYPWQAAQPAAAAAQAAAQRQPVIQIHNHFDKQIGIAAIDTPQGNRQVLNVLRANPGAVRSYSGTRR